jgi:hypothetical protein
MLPDIINTKCIGTWICLEIKKGHKAPLVFIKRDVLFHNIKLDSFGIIDLKIVYAITEALQRKLMLMSDSQALCHDPAEIVCDSDSMSSLI